MLHGFDVNSLCDNLDSYSIFDDVAESMDFASVGIDTTPPVEENVIRPIQPIVPTTPTRPTKKVETIKNNIVKLSGKRGRKPGAKGKCGLCGKVGHYKPKCSIK